MSDYQFKHDYPELEALYNFPSKAITDVSDVNFVITHGNCADGFMSRVVIEKEMRENPDRFTTSLDDVEFVDCSYGQNFNDLPEQMRGKVVLICDFSFKPELFQQMIESTGGRILVLDHHATAQSNFKGIDPKYAVFDMTHSGAFITQVFVHGFQNVPKAVLYVEDNDIWKKELPNTFEFTAFMFLQEFDYDSYVKLFDDAFVQDHAIPIGVGAVLQNQAHIDNILGRTMVSFMEVKGRYYFVANVNCAGILRSELGSQALKKFTRSNFAFCYTQNLKYGSTSISLRSMDDRTDVSYVAGLFGGGGHRNAAGMGTSTLQTQMPGRIIDEYRAYDLLQNVYTRTIGVKKFLLLNTPVIKTALSRYLMQDRFVGERDSAKNIKRCDMDLPAYQEGMFVMRENAEDTDLDEVYHGALCYHYDGNRGHYEVTLVPLRSEVEAVRDLIADDAGVLIDEAPMLEFTENKGVFYISFSRTAYDSVDAFAAALGDVMA